MLLNRLILGDQATDTEVANLDAPLMVHEDVIEFDISVQDAAAMTMSDTMHNLLENALRSLLIQVLPLLNILKQVATIRILHYKQEMLRALEDLE